MNNLETKLIIEGKEFQIIKYSCESNDKWYIGELGLVIEKKVWKASNPANKKVGQVSWYGASSGKEAKQLAKLIYWGECEVDDWKEKIRKLNKTWPDIKSDAGKEISDKLDRYNENLQRATKGLVKLKSLEKVHYQKEVIMNNLNQITNKQLLKELAKRITFGRLELEEGIEFNQLLQIKCPSQTHYVDILDNEWTDRIKPDYTGARTGLIYWLAHIKYQVENETKVKEETC